MSHSNLVDKKLKNNFGSSLFQLLFNPRQRMAPAYIETDSGNKVSRQCTIVGSQNIILGGKTIIQPGVIVRGDLRRAGVSSSGNAVVVAVGKYCVLGEGSIIRPPYKTYKG